MQLSRPNNNSLSSRLLVSFIGIPGLLLLIWLGSLPYLLLIAAIVFLGLWEYSRLIRALKLTGFTWHLIIGAAILLLVAGQDTGTISGASFAYYTDSFMVVLAVLMLAMMSQVVYRNSENAWLSVATNLIGFLWIAGAGITFILLRNFSAPGLLMHSQSPGLSITLALFVSVWACDTSAYVIGKKYGKVKILPKVSPKKTVVGSIAGVIAAVLVIQAFSILGWLTGFRIYDLLVLGLIVGLVGQLGDFAESQLKRDAGVKDSGTLLPGHGGVLDRFDSLFFVMPVSYLYLQFIFN